MRLFLIGLALIVPAFLVTTTGFGDEGARLKTPLDLPSGGLAGDDEEEDAPETITFYGNEFEGDGFFWCFPAYGFCGVTTAFELIKQEITQSMNQLSQTSWIGLVAFNIQTPHIWSPMPKLATIANKSSALGWMATLVPIESHCLKEGALATLQLSQMSSGDATQVIIMGARAPYCAGQSGSGYIAEVLEAVTGANYENSPIHTVYVTSTFYSGEGVFYQDLAAMNQGTFFQIDY